MPDFSLTLHSRSSAPESLTSPPESLVRRGTHARTEKEADGTVISVVLSRTIQRQGSLHVDEQVPEREVLRLGQGVVVRSVQVLLNFPRLSVLLSSSRPTSRENTARKAKKNVRNKL